MILCHEHEHIMSKGSGLMMKRLLILLSIVCYVLSLVGCETSDVEELIHPKTDRLDITQEVFSKSDYKPYTVGGILFIPYTRPNGFENSEQDYYKFSLRLAAYKTIDNTNKVVINHVKIAGTKNVTLEEIDRTLSLPLDFIESKEFQSIQESSNILIEEISPTNMNLSDESVMTVVINVSVEENGEMINKDLTYKFQGKVSTYNVQR
jgi:hypothetical protein